MGERTVAENSSQYALDAMLQEVVDMFEMDDGKTFEEKKKAMRQRLKFGDAGLNQADSEAAHVQDAFWKAGEMLFSDEFSMRKVMPSDIDGYISLQRHYSSIKSMLNSETYCNILWKEYTQARAFMLTIEHGGEYVGYCGIKDTTQNPWEIAIELLPQWTNQGVGGKVLSTMLDAMKERLNITEYRVRIDPSNYASQHLFEKLGAVPNGISEFWIHDADTLARCEEENLMHITEQTVEVAEKFHVEPRRLLSHVLEYRLHWGA